MQVDDITNNFLEKLKNNIEKEMQDFNNSEKNAEKEKTLDTLFRDTTIFSNIITSYMYQNTGELTEAITDGIKNIDFNDDSFRETMSKYSSMFNK